MFTCGVSGQRSRMQLMRRTSKPQIYRSVHSCQALQWAQHTCFASQASGVWWLLEQTASARYVPCYYLHSHSDSQAVSTRDTAGPPYECDAVQAHAYPAVHAAGGTHGCLRFRAFSRPRSNRPRIFLRMVSELSLFLGMQRHASRLTVSCCTPAARTAGWVLVPRATAASHDGCGCTAMVTMGTLWLADSAGGPLHMPLGLPHQRARSNTEIDVLFRHVACGDRHTLAVASQVQGAHDRRARVRRNGDTLWTVANMWLAGVRVG